MADVFEKESSPTQDATYREHLDRNWEAGNKKFAELEGKVKNTEEKCQDIIGDQDSNDADKKKKEERIRALETQVVKLNLAVFGDGATEVQTISSNQENHSQLAKEVRLD